MSIKTGIETTKRQYEEKVFSLLRNRKNKDSKYFETQVWSMLEVAYNRGFYFGDALLSQVDSSERFIDSRMLLNVLFDFISPVEICILLVGKSQFFKSNDVENLQCDSIYSNTKPAHQQGDTPLKITYIRPDKDGLFVRGITDEVDPQRLEVGEQPETQRDYDRALNRGQKWRDDCRVIFNAVWSNSKPWGYLLTTGFKDVSDMRFTDHGVDFISTILIRATSRGFAYKEFFVNEISLADQTSELSDCFALAILLFISPSELYHMLDVSLHFAPSKYAKTRDPKMIKMAS